jgi:hypothetical protein
MNFETGTRSVDPVSRRGNDGLSSTDVGIQPDPLSEPVHSFRNPLFCPDPGGAIFHSMLDIFTNLTKELQMKLLSVSIMITALFSISFPLVSIADVLLIEEVRGAPPNNSSGVPRPSRGMRMNVVKQKFGEPETIAPAVGIPPITQWDYEAYSVYFENDTVLHSVVHRASGN